MAVNDPTASATPAADLQSLLIAQLAPIAQQAAAQASQDATAGLSSIVAGIQSDLSNVQKTVQAHQVQIEQQVANAGGAVIANVERHQWLQRVIALSILGAILAGALIVLVGYLTGNAQAAKIIAGVPAAVGGLVLLFVRLDGVALPKPAAK